MLASSLGRYLANVHDIYQLQMVAEELLEHQPPGDLHHHASVSGKISMSVPDV
jgi:hypothetical protein